MFHVKRQQTAPHFQSIRIRGFKTVSFAAILKVLGLNIIRSVRFKYGKKLVFRYKKVGTLIMVLYSDILSLILKIKSKKTR